LNKQPRRPENGSAKRGRSGFDSPRISDGSNADYNRARELEDWLAAEAQWTPPGARTKPRGGRRRRVFEAVRWFPDMISAFSPILPSLPQSMLLQFAKKAVLISCYAARVIAEVCPYLTHESVSL
jgi:hypothetical protein